MEKNQLNKTILSDCFEIFFDIIKLYKSGIENKHIPNFIVKMRDKKYLRKFNKKIEKIKEINIPLEYRDILQFAEYIYNNFQPLCSFGHIVEIIHIEKGFNIWKISIVDGDESYNLRFSDDIPRGKFEFGYIKKKEDKTVQMQTTTIGKLYSEDEINKEILFNLNKIILNDIADYIKYTVDNTDYH